MLLRASSSARAICAIAGSSFGCPQAVGSTLGSAIICPKTVSSRILLQISRRCRSVGATGPCYGSSSNKLFDSQRPAPCLGEVAFTLPGNALDVGYRNSEHRQAEALQLHLLRRRRKRVRYCLARHLKPMLRHSTSNPQLPINHHVRNPRT